MLKNDNVHQRCRMSKYKWVLLCLRDICYWYIRIVSYDWIIFKMKWRQTYIPGLNVTFQNFKTIELSKIIKKKANSDSIEISKEEFSGIADCAKQNQTYNQLIEVLGVSLLPSSEIIKEFETAKAPWTPLSLWQLLKDQYSSSWSGI